MQSLSFKYVLSRGSQIDSDTYLDCAHSNATNRLADALLDPRIVNDASALPYFKLSQRLVSPLLTWAQLIMTRDSGIIIYICAYIGSLVIM